MPVKKNPNRRGGIEGIPAQIAIYVIMGITVVLVMLPVFLSLLMSFKSNFELAGSIWAFPKEWLFSNWAFGVREMLPNMLNSVVISLVSTFFVVFLGSLSAFVFVRMEFFGRNFLFQLVILLMLIPSIITLTPLYLLCVNLGIDNTWFALWLPSVAGGQVSAIFLFSIFFRQQPKDIFDAAKIDGAGAIRMYLSLCLPLAVPVLCIQAVNTFAMCYNDFMWPSIIISETSKQPLMPVLRNLANVASLNSQEGASYAMYLMSGIPLVFTTLIGLKYFIGGEFASGMKL